MIAYDYDALFKNGSKDVIFEKYDVLLLVKTLSLRIPGVKSVTLEEIMNFNNINVVDEVLSYYLEEGEIEYFNLKNFSLQSVLENLTILNAQKLLDYVSDATTLLQQMLKRRFLSKTVIGINMHICFLIERLVTKTPIENYENLDAFEAESGGKRESILITTLSGQSKAEIMKTLSDKDVNIGKELLCKD